MQGCSQWLQGQLAKGHSKKGANFIVFEKQNEVQSQEGELPSRSQLQ